MTKDSKVVLNPGTGGSTVQTRETTTLQPDGTLATVEQQVVVLVDANGIPVDFAEVVNLLREINTTLQQLLSQERGGL